MSGNQVGRRTPDGGKSKNNMSTPQWGGHNKYIKTRPTHWRTDANLYPPEDNTPKPVNHHLTLKEESKVKSDNIRRFPAHDMLQVGFILQTSRINNERVIRTFKFGWSRLTLKEGLKAKCDHIRRFPVHDLL